MENFYLLQLKNIKKKFKDNEILKGINLTLKEKEILVITGPDGSGKSVLLKIIAGLLKPDEGEIIFLGSDLLKEREKFKDKICYSSESFSLYPDLTVEETMYFFGEIYEDKKIIEERIQKILELTELKEKKKNKVKELSGGMQKKLSLATLLIYRPKLLLLDEPTRGIDPVSRSKLWNLFHKLKENGISIIITTPYILETKRADRFFLLKEGYLQGGLEEEEFEKKNFYILNKKEKIIRLKNLTKKFGNFIAVKNLSFEIERGEIFALLGPNGAGKTTTLKMLLGIISPTEGEIEILGEKLSKENIRKIRKNIGYLSQKFSLYPDLTLYQNLKFYSGLYEVQKEKERIEELIELLNMGNWRNNLASELPLGVKQRLSLACAIINNPPLLFLDEPTSGMGVETRKEFWEILSNLKEKETTMILTTHYMDEAEYCDRILLIDKGENKALDSPFNLKKKFLEEYKIYEIKVEKIWEFENLIEKEEEVIFTRTKNGFKIFSRKEEKILEIVKKLEESGIKIINFEKSEPDLEEVFYAKVLS